MAAFWPIASIVEIREFRECQPKFHNAAYAAHAPPNPLGANGCSASEAGNSNYTPGLRGGWLLGNLANEDLFFFVFLHLPHAVSRSSPKVWGFMRYGAAGKAATLVSSSAGKTASQPPP